MRLFIYIFLNSFVFKLEKQQCKAELLTFIVAPCLLESRYCSLTNKCTFY